MLRVPKLTGLAVDLFRQLVRGRNDGRDGPLPPLQLALVHDVDHAGQHEGCGLAASGLGDAQQVPAVPFREAWC